MVLVVHVLKISVKFSEWSFVYIMELGCDTWLIKSWTWTLETIAHVVHGHFIAYSPLKILSKHEDIHRIGECFFPIPCPHCPQESSPTWYWAWNRVWSIWKIVPMILNIAIGFGSFHPSSVHRKKIMEVQICIIWKKISLGRNLPKAKVSHESSAPKSFRNLPLGPFRGTQKNVAKQKCFHRTKGTLIWAGLQQSRVDSVDLWWPKKKPGHLFLLFCWGCDLMV